MVNNLYYDPQSGQYFDRANRFKSAYEPVPYEGQNVMRAFEVMSYVPLVGAPFNVVLGIGAIQDGHPFLGGLQILGGFADAFAIAGIADAAKGSYALWKAARVTTQGAGGRIIASSGGMGSFDLLSEADLSKHIRGIHARLPQSGATATFHKGDVAMRQLRTLTGVTGDEYMMFTNGSRRLVIRGQGSDVTIYSEDLYLELLYGMHGRYSGHTHPRGHSLFPGPADRPFLQNLGQGRSGIWGSVHGILGAKPFEAGKPFGAGWLPF